MSAWTPRLNETPAAAHQGGQSSIPTPGHGHSLRRSAIISRMFGRYVIRRVLSLGPLRSPGTRAFLAGAVLVFTGGGAVIAFQFLKPVGNDLMMWTYVHDLATISVTMMATAIFLGLRLILGGSESFLTLTYQLPVTNQERRAAMLWFEVVSVTVLISLLTAATLTATLLLLGPSGVWLACTPLLTALTCYLLLSILYNLGDRLLTRLGLLRARQSILLLIVFAGLLLFNSQIPRMVTTVSIGDGERMLLGVNLFPWMVASFGPFSLISAALLLPCLWLIALATAPVVPPGNTRFTNLPLPWLPHGAWGLHLAYALRNGHLWLGMSLSSALFTYLLISGGMHPLWAGLLLVIPGMYHYGNTGGARAMHPDQSALRIWWRILGTELAVVGALLVVLTAIACAVRPALLAGAPAPILAVLGSVLFSVLVGCAFPAENDNPFSVLLGLLVLCLCLGFVGIVSGLLDLPNSTTIPLLVALHILAAGASVLAIHTNESRTRHVTLPERNRLPGGGRHGHPDHRRRHPAVSHGFNARG